LAKRSLRRQAQVQIPAARFSEAWEIFFGLKRFAKMRGFADSAVRGGFAMGGFGKVLEAALRVGLEKKRGL
jgi:hypothetical protein